MFSESVPRYLSLKNPFSITGAGSWGETFPRILAGTKSWTCSYTFVQIMVQLMWRKKFEKFDFALLNLQKALFYLFSYLTAPHAV